MAKSTRTEAVEAWESRTVKRAGAVPAGADGSLTVTSSILIRGEIPRSPACVRAPGRSTRPARDARGVVGERPAGEQARAGVEKAVVVRIDRLRVAVVPLLVHLADHDPQGRPCRTRCRCGARPCSTGRPSRRSAAWPSSTRRGLHRLRQPREGDGGGRPGLASKRARAGSQPRYALCAQTVWTPMDRTPAAGTRRRGQFSPLLIGSCCES